MKLPRQLQLKAKQLWQTKRHFRKPVDPDSLRVRLTVGVVSVAIVGLGSVAIWIAWKMQEILISTHKDNVQYISDRLPHHVEIYSEMMPLPEATQRAIDNLATKQIYLWVENKEGQVLAHSRQIDNPNTVYALYETPMPPFVLQVRQVDGRYWVLCAGYLEVNGERAGIFFVAQDVNTDRQVFAELIRNLGLASAVAIATTTVVLAVYVKRSLQPLQEMSQLTEAISAEQLGEARVHFERAPTEVKELAHTFDRMLMRLFESWEQQRQFVSNVSHELRTPLTIVSGYLQSTLRRGNNLSDLQREALVTAATEADRTIQLLADLLTLARADNGQVRFRLEPLNLHEFLATVVEMGRQYSGRKIDLSSPYASLQLCVDSDRFKQVLLNLIDNAVKYSDPEEPIAVSVEVEGEWAHVKVSDRGVGIPLYHQARIFDRFYRVDEARSRATGGTGLGLSIVKMLVEGMGGRITVASKPGEGSTFTVSFPILAL